MCGWKSQGASYETLPSSTNIYSKSCNLLFSEDALLNSRRHVTANDAVHFIRLVSNPFPTWFSWNTMRGTALHTFEVSSTYVCVLFVYPCFIRSKEEGEEQELARNNSPN